jgi:hypothetical protein
MADNFMTDVLKAHIEACCEKHEIREPDKSKILEWAATTTDGVARALLESVAEGMIEIVGLDAEGGPLMRLLPAGEKHVQHLLQRTGHKTPGEFLGLE